MELPVAAVVKLGGAAITWKDTMETLNEPALKACATAIARAVQLEDERCVDEDDEDTEGRRGGRRVKGIVVVHGAGSFGHFQAQRYGVSKGVTSVPFESNSKYRGESVVDATRRAMRDSPELLKGVAETRQSVTKLNHLVVAALLAEGVPAVGMSPFGGWVTRGGVVNAAARAHSAAAVRAVRAAVAAGLVPVIHGDVVLDDARGCAILSGDTVTQELAAALRPDRAVFLTNVLGVFNRPPTTLNPEKSGAGDWAVLLREISVGAGGCANVNVNCTPAAPDWKVEKALATEQYEEEEECSVSAAAADEATKMKRVVVKSRRAEAGTYGASAAAATVVGMTSADASLSLTTAEHDVTGGIAAKVAEAGAVCALTDVFIAAAGTAHAAAAVVGAVDKARLTSSAARGAERDEEWLGTYVRMRR
jgi:isopentenyl phosphate kinase